MAEGTPTFQQVHAAYRLKVQRYLTRLVGETEAEDLTQEVFMKIYQGLPSFRGESQLSTWIYRIAAHAAYDRLRSPSFRRIAPDGLPEDHETGEVCLYENTAWAGDVPVTPEQRVLQKQRLECYCDFIKSLPENYRRIVALSELEALATGEIAELLGLSVDVVKIRLHRGRERLLREIRARCKPEDWL